MKNFIILYLLLISLFSYSATLQEVEDNIKHANTYYWLSRVTQGEMKDIKEILNYANKAKKNLISLKENKKTKEMLNEIDLIIKQANAQIEEHHDLIINSSPTFSYLIGQNSVYEFFDNPKDIAIEKSIENLFEDSPWKRNKNQLKLLILSSPKDIITEEITNSYINDNTLHYQIKKNELMQILSLEEYNSLYKKNISADILNKIAKFYSVDEFGILTIKQKDYVNSLYFFEANFKSWDINKSVFQRNYTKYGFSKKGQSSIWVYLFLLIGFPITFLFNKINNKSKGSYVSIWLSSLIGLFTLCISAISFAGINYLEIDKNSFIAMPYSIACIIVIICALSIIPLFINYLILGKLPSIHKNSNKPECLSSFIFGSLLGSVLFYASHINLALGQELTLQYFFIAISVITVISFFLGKSFSDYSIKNNMSSLIISIIYLFITFIFFTFSYILNYNCLLYCSVICIISTTAIALLNKIIFLTKTKNIVNKIDKNKDLHSFIKEPPFCKDIIQDEFNKAVDFISNNKDSLLEVLIIEGDRGVGKTRTAEEIAKAISKESKVTTHVLSGDISESNEHSTPYEPFKKALGEHLEGGYFLDPAKKSKNLAKGISDLGLESAGIAGSILSKFLNPRDNDKKKQETTEEISKIIAETLIKISNKNSEVDNEKIILKIDDLQWIDEDSFKMLTCLFRTLSTQFNNNEISFIFTTHSNNHSDVMNFINKQQKDGKINLKTINLNHTDYDKSKLFINNLLIKLPFENKTQNNLKNFFENKGVSNPLDILETLETILDKKWFARKENNEYKLLKQADLNLLPPPEEYIKMVKERLNGLDDKIINILQCSSMIGKTFNISIIAKIFNLDILELLDLLKDAEIKGIIEDLQENDDLYHFVDKRMVAIFKNINNSSESLLEQRVREYRKRYIAVIESNMLDIENINSITQESRWNQIKDLLNENIDFEGIKGLANNSYAIRDVFPKRAFTYNKLAAELALKNNFLAMATTHYEFVINMIKEENNIVDDNIKFEIYNNYYQMLLDQEKNINLIPNEISKIVNFEKENLRKSEIDLLLLEILANYRLRYFTIAQENAEKIMNDSNADLSQKTRAKFYYAISIAPSEAEKKLAILQEVLKEIENFLNKENDIELMKIYAECSNSLGFSSLHSLKNIEMAKKYFKMALDINKDNNFNKKGIAIAYGGLGDCFNKLEDYEDAIKMYNKNYKISKTYGDLTGISRMTSMLGEINLKLAESADSEKEKELLNLANGYYKESLLTSQEQENNVGIAFACMGLISVKKNIDEDFEPYIKRLKEAKTTINNKDIIDEINKYI